VILVDTSVWIDHLHRGDVAMQARLRQGQVLTHPFVIGELAMGSLRQREIVLSAMADLPAATVAHEHEVLRFVSDNNLFGLGIGYIDAHLLAATRLTPGTLLWTRDKRLNAIAARLFLAAELTG
jgi:predicted nucleic acid-binding protein